MRAFARNAWGASSFLPILLLALVSLLITACGGGSNPTASESSDRVLSIAMPEAITAQAVDPTKRTGVVIVDPGLATEARCDLTIIGNEGTCTIGNVATGDHQIQIQWIYNDPTFGQTLILEEANKSISVTGGVDNPVTIADSDYSEPPPDFDGDDVSNIDEIRLDTNPTDSSSVPPEVPNVVGQLEVDARLAIENAGLVVGQISRESSDSIPEGQVIQQTPAGGELVVLGTAVNLVVSQGVDDNTAPTATASPASNSIIRETANITVNFSESMDTTTLTLSGTMAAESDGGVWSDTTLTNDTLTISPSTTWSEASGRTLTIAVTDLGGNLLEAPLNLVYTVSSTPIVTITPSGSFDLVNGFSNTGLVAAPAAGIIVVAVSFVDRPELDVYDTSGNSLGTIPLTDAPATHLGGYTDIAERDDSHVYLISMIDSSRNTAIYTFTKDGLFVSAQSFAPAINNGRGIAFDGEFAYINQNDSPSLLYKVDPGSGTVIQTFDTNPGHGQRLDLAYWPSAGMLVESYDDGISMLDPIDGSELQHFSSAELGYDAQTFGVAVSGDTLYLMTRTRTPTVFTYTMAVSTPIP